VRRIVVEHAFNKEYLGFAYPILSFIEEPKSKEGGKSLMAESSDSDWGADVGLDDDFRASGSDDADDWLQDVEEKEAPAFATPNPKELHSGSQSSAPLAHSSGGPPLPAPTPQSKPRTPEQLPVTRTTPQMYHQPNLTSPHRSSSRGGITPATPINPLFLEEDEAEGAPGGNASDEDQHQRLGHAIAAIPLQASGIPEVHGLGLRHAAPRIEDPVPGRQREDLLHGEQELAWNQQQQQHSKHGNLEDALGKGAQHAAPGKQQQQPLQLSGADKQQQEPLQQPEADRQQQQPLQLSGTDKQQQQPLQLSAADAHGLPGQKIKQQQQQQQQRQQLHDQKVHTAVAAA